MNILLCTDGSPHSAWALNVGASVALPLAGSVDILIVAETEERRVEVLRGCDAVVAELQAAGLPPVLHHRRGRLAEAVEHQAQGVPYDLVVIGSRGRRGLTSLLLGSVARHVAEHIPASLLVVKGPLRQLEHFLVCSAAGPASERTVRFAGRLAHSLGAAVTLIHVMSQLPLTPFAVPEDLEASADELVRRGSREGVHLSCMLDLLAEEGINGRAIVRHGLVLDEILDELSDGCYDLLITGTHVTPGLHESLVEDMSTDLLLEARLPVLIVRQGHGGTQATE